MRVVVEERRELKFQVAKVGVLYYIAERPLKDPQKIISTYPNWLLDHSPR